MIGQIEGVKIISSFHTRSKPYGKIESRATHGFIYRIKGWAEYCVDGETVKVNEGEMIFLPKGSRYEYATTQDEENLYTSINFDADMEKTEITSYSLKNFQCANYIFGGFSERWNFGNLSDKYACLSDFYSIVAYVSKFEETEGTRRKSYQTIEPAVEYLKSHMYDENLKVDKLHRLCGISDTYFRRIFLARFNMTPQEYITNNRIIRARSIIESGDYDSIKEVAEAVGFSDALYFSKVFRKHYGFPPSRISE